MPAGLKDKFVFMAMEDSFYDYEEKTKISLSDELPNLTKITSIEESDTLECCVVLLCENKLVETKGVINPFGPDSTY